MTPEGPDTDEFVLKVSNLRSQLLTRDGPLTVVDGVSLQLRPGETLGLIGESGSGKSMTARSILRLLPSQGRITSGSVLYRDVDLVKISSRKMAAIRGDRIAMILQDPMSSMHPAFTVGHQITEPIAVRGRLGRRERHKAATSLLQMVSIPEPAIRARQYPHELSGGMKQRSVGAAAVACTPDVVIADEPTTALDVTTQAAFLDMLKRLQRDVGFGLLLISHDLGVIARVSDRIAVMYAGRIVESGPSRAVLSDPQHPYTQALLRSTLPMNQRLHRLPTITGQPPSAGNWDEGCRFSPRCPLVHDECADYPPNFSVGADHSVACWLRRNDHG